MMDALVKLAGDSFLATALITILVWFYRNGPRWVDKHFKLMEAFFQGHKEEVREIQATFRAEIREEREQWAEQFEKTQAQADRHMDRIIETLEQSNENTRAAFQQVSAQVAAHHAFSQDESRRMEEEIRRRQS